MEYVAICGSKVVERQLSSSLCRGNSSVTRPGQTLETAHHTADTNVLTRTVQPQGSHSSYSKSAPLNKIKNIRQISKGYSSFLIVYELFYFKK